jgi:hypothetical protein
MDQVKEQNPNHEKAVQVSAGGRILQADFAVPESACGVVLFAHGSGSSRRSPRNRYVAQVLQKAGLATLLMDLLTPEEEAFDAHTAALRFDIGLLAGRLVESTGGCLVSQQRRSCTSVISVQAPARRQLWWLRRNSLLLSQPSFRVEVGQTLPGKPYARWLRPHC